MKSVIGWPASVGIADVPLAGNCKSITTNEKILGRQFAGV
jgi:hypothetical protein